LPVNGEESVAYPVLRRVADRVELQQAADLLHEDFPAIAELFRRAIRAAGHPAK
jgi:hypothetical protein